MVDDVSAGLATVLLHSRAIQLVTTVAFCPIAGAIMAEEVQKT